MASFERQPSEDKDAARIAGMRKREEERRLRIFNERERTVGVDKEALDRQVQEKREQKERERMLNILHDKRALELDGRLQALEEARRKMRQEADVALEEFRRNFQNKEQRREYYELNDPDQLKKDPYRFEDETKLGPSSMRNFAGEDLARDERISAQQKQLSEWAKLIDDERGGLIRQQLESDRDYEARLEKVNQWAMAKEREMAAAKTKLLRDMADTNNGLAVEKKDREAQEFARSELESQREIRAHLSGDLLTENPAQGHSALGPGRKTPYAYKGMPESECKDIYAAVGEQQREKRDRLAREQAEKAADERALLANNAITEARVRELDADRQRRRLDHAEDNQKRGEEQRRREAERNKTYTTNTPTSAFFEQFGTTSR